MTVRTDPPPPGQQADAERVAALGFRPLDIAEVMHEGLALYRATMPALAQHMAFTPRQIPDYSTPITPEQAERMLSTLQNGSHQP